MLSLNEMQCINTAIKIYSLYTMWSEAEHARVSLEARNSIADELNNIEKGSRRINRSVKRLHLVNLALKAGPEEQIKEFLNLNGESMWNEELDDWRSEQLSNMVYRMEEKNKYNLLKTSSQTSQIAVGKKSKQKACNKTGQHSKKKFLEP